MDAHVVKQMVRQFREKTGYTGGEPHCFAPWYLQCAFRLSETQAMQQSSDGSYDFGVDAFHLLQESNGKPSTLILVQAKYSESLQHIAKGFRDLQRALPEVLRNLKGIGTEEPIQNNVLVNLRATLNRLDTENRERLLLDFRVLHLSVEDELVLLNRLREPMTRLVEALRDILDDYSCNVTQIGPRELGPPLEVVAPPEEVALHIDGGYEFPAGNGARMFLGMGRLAELVKLYNIRRDDLFSRNVRYYLFSRKNTEKGPAGKMRATLKQMCLDGAVEPERFALFHNGVTMFSRRARLVDGQIRVRDPYVLNGCQTVKNAFFFRFDPHLKSKIKDECWQRIAVPVRIIETTDDELVRSVTVNTNRQNAISPVALRANDPAQIRLEHRFKERGLFYQRQEGALENVEMMQPELLDDLYENTPRGAAVDIHDIARSLAATGGEIRLALHPNDLFESDTAYARCFNEKTRLRSIVFLTFLQNLHDTVGVVLKKNLDLRPQEQNGPKPSRFIYHTICLFTRYLAREDMRAFIVQWGTKLYLSDKDFREEIRRILNSNKSGIRNGIARNLMALATGNANDISAAFERCTRELHLTDGIHPFEVFATLDEEAPYTPSGP